MNTSLLKKIENKTYKVEKISISQMQLLLLWRLQEEIIVAFQSLRVILNTTQSPQIPIAQLCSPALAMHSLLMLNRIP